MNRRFILSILICLAAVAGYPYAALVINRVIGTNTVVFTEHDSVQRTLISGPSAPRPEWVPVVPGAITVQAAHWQPSPGREIAGSVDLLTHKSVDEIKHFYLEALKSAGFDMRDIGYGYMNAGSAAFFGMDNQLLGYRGDTDVTISVATRAPSGLMLRPRIVQLHWQRWDKSQSRERLEKFGLGASGPIQ